MSCFDNVENVGLLDYVYIAGRPVAIGAETSGPYLWSRVSSDDQIHENDLNNDGELTNSYSGPAVSYQGLYYMGGNEFIVVNSGENTIAKHTLSGDSFSEDWTYDWGSDMWNADLGFNVGEPVGIDENGYVLVGGGGAVDSADEARLLDPNGNLQWTYQTGGGCHACMAGAGDTWYIGEGEGSTAARAKVRKLDGSGNELWTGYVQNDYGDDEYSEIETRCIARTENAVYGISNGRVAAFNPSDGTRIWQTGANGPLRCRGHPSGDVLVTEPRGFNPGACLRYSGSDGSLVWEWTASSNCTADYIVVHPDTGQVFVATERYESANKVSLHEIDPADGSGVWTKNYLVGDGENRYIAGAGEVNYNNIFVPELR